MYTCARGSGNQGSVGALLRTTQDLSAAVSELRAAGSDASVLTESRLASIESELKRTAERLARSEQLLIPLPSAAVRPPGLRRPCRA